ncbi:MAG: VWA domain-containing protein [Dechloromonas sp.]|nr:VWA domain-containing protein [Dechloromonas sp.]
MAIPGIRSPADARQRPMASAEAQAAWATIDCGLAAVADIFDQAWLTARQQLAADDLPEFLLTARWLGKLGRGADPVLAFLAHWPALLHDNRMRQDDLLPYLRSTLVSLQKSPNAPAITVLLQNLAPVVKQLRSADAVHDYLRLTLDLAERTTPSLHGHHKTHPSPALPVFLGQAPRLLSLVALAGLGHWLDDGIRLCGDHPEQQRAFFGLETPDSRALLQRQRSGTLFARCERWLSLTLRALWQDDSPLIPYSTAFSAAHQRPYLAADGLRLPDALEDYAGISGRQRYQAMLAHLAGHRRWSQPLIADNWSPLQRLTVETLEDARIDTLILRHLPGLSATLLALHPTPAEDACDPQHENCLRHRLICLSRACLDPAHPYRQPLLLEFVERFQQQLADGPASTQAMADLALAYASRSRQASDQFAQVHFTDTDVDYRDDNRHLWRFIEAGDEEDLFAPPPSTAPEEASSLPPRFYPEWDAHSQQERPDWVAVYEALHPAGQAADIDRLLDKHAVLARRLKRLLDLLKPQDRVRLRYQEDGSELDLDVAVRAWTDWRSGQLPDGRINISHTTAGRDISVLLLLDLSQSLNNTLPGGTQTLLDTAREAVALLGWAIGELGDAYAIAGFHSNTRHELRYHHIKGFSEAWDDPVKARLAAVQAGWSTRMGGALRHAGHLLSARRSAKRLLLVLTDGQPADVDVSDPQHLITDSKKAVDTLSSAGISTFCFSLDPQADAYVGQIFGPHWRILDQVDRLPEQLPLLYLGLTR